MPADRLRRLRGPERPAAALPALSPLPPCRGLPEAILKGAERLRPAAAPLWAPCRPAVGHAAPCCPVALAAPPCGPTAGPCRGLPGLPPCGRPCPPSPAAFTPVDWRLGVRTIAHLKCYLLGLHLTNYN